MKIFLFFLGIVGAFFVTIYCPTPFDWIGIAGAALLSCWSFYPKKKTKKTPSPARYIKFANMVWSINDFCRGWLITGQTGSGKTACAIRNLLHSLYRDCPDFGGAVVDEKGQFFEIVYGIAKHYHLENKLIILRVNEQEKPICKYNLLSYPGIPWSSYAAVIIDTSESMGNKLDPFWKRQAEMLLTNILTLIAVDRVPTLGDLCDYLGLSNLMQLSQEWKMRLQIGDYTHQIEQAATELSDLVKMIPATRDGILASTKTAVDFCGSPEIREVFCPLENTIDFRDIDKGKIFVLSMGQKYNRERIFFNTFLKLLFTSHARYRFDDAQSLPSKNLLVFVADEAQKVVTASAHSSDHEAVAIMREAKATYIFATQSITSFATKLKREAVDTLVLNFATQLYFTVSDQEAAEKASKSLGLKKSKEITKSTSSQGVSNSERDIEKPLYSPADLRQLHKYECVIKHPCNQTQRRYLPPLDDRGKIPYYYYADRFWGISKILYWLQF